MTATQQRSFNKEVALNLAELTTVTKGKGGPLLVKTPRDRALVSTMAKAKARGISPEEMDALIDKDNDIKKKEEWKAVYRDLLKGLLKK